MHDEASSRVEMCLAAAVMDCLRTKANEYISEDESLHNVCRWLSPFAQALLRGDRTWSRYSSVDGIIPCTVIRIQPNTLKVEGLLIWMSTDKKNREWKEPLFTELSLSAQRLKFDLRIGDADRGLAKCLYAVSHDYPHVPVKNWLFTFSN
ncbi:MAG TPA: hypothetical protein VG714_05060 [Acidobacteriaceae bacterium]|nr:hypothetical protein [Acidobacteriaceae bacterium]